MSATDTLVPAPVDGVGISKVTEYYLVSDSLTGVTASTSGWSTDVQTPTASNRYLWNYELVTYTDGSTSKTTPAVIGVYGDQGDKGDKGEKGAKIDMCKWESVPSTYRFYAGSDGEALHSVAYYNGLWYSCKITHIKGAHTNPQDDVAYNMGYWTVSEYTEFIATDLILARKIKAHEIEVDELTVKTLDTSGDGARVSILGGISDVYGAVNSLFPNIRFGVNDDGYAVMQYFDNEGRFLYDLGPTGISDLSVREENWLTSHRKYLGTDESSVIQAQEYIGVLYADGENVYQYVSQMVAGVIQDPANDGRFFSTRIKSSTYLLNGWYCQTARQGQTSEVYFQWTDAVEGLLPKDISEYNPPLTSGKTIHAKVLEYYEDGLLTRRQNVYWTD